MFHTCKVSFFFDKQKNFEPYKLVICEPQQSGGHKMAHVDDGRPRQKRQEPSHEAVDALTSDLFSLIMMYVDNVKDLKALSFTCHTANTAMKDMYFLTRWLIKHKEERNVLSTLCIMTASWTRYPQNAVSTILQIAPNIKVNWYVHHRYTCIDLAAKLGNANMIRDLVANGAAVELACGPMVRADLTPLYIAAKYGKLCAVVELLTDNQAGAINCKCGLEEMTPLMIAAYNGHTEIAVRLLEAGARCDILSKGSNSTLMYVLRGAGKKRSGVDTGIMKLVHIILDKHPDSLLLHNANGLTPLMLAASQGMASMVAYLVSKGADVNFANEKDDTALIMGAMWGDVTNILIRAGAHVGARNKRKWTALIVAIRSKCEMSVRLLLETNNDTQLRRYNAENCPICHAAINGQSLIVKLLLHAGAEVNAGHCMPLVLAVRYGHANVVDTLLEAKANIYDFPSDSPPPIALVQDLSTCYKLLQAGAISNRMFQYKWNVYSVLSFVIIYSSHLPEIIQITQALYDDGARLLPSTHEKVIDIVSSPPPFGTRRDVKLMLMLFIKYGVNPNTVCTHTKKPILCMAASNDYDYTKVLLDNGADINIKDCDGRTAMMYAIEASQIKTMTLLIERGANTTHILHQMVKKNAIVDVKKMLKSGLRLKGVLYKGSTMTATAARNRNVDMMKVLVQCGDDVHHTIVDLATHGPGAYDALHLKGQLELIKQSGGDINCPSDVSGDTPLMRLAIVGVAKVVIPSMLSVGADASIVNSITGNSVLFAAVENPISGPNAVKMLAYATGVDINHRNAHGETALHWAIKKNSLSSLQMLLLCGANPNISDNMGCTPLQRAIEFHGIESACAKTLSIYNKTM